MRNVESRLNILLWGILDLFLLQERIEYSCATLLCELHDLGGGQASLVTKYIKKRYIDIQLSYYLDELVELLVGHRLP